MKKYQINSVLGDGWGSSYDERIQEKVSFHIHQNGNGIHCYLRAIGQGSDPDLTIDIPSSFKKEERSVYYHPMTFEKKEIKESGLSTLEKERRISQYETKHMGREHYIIITNDSNLPEIEGMTLYSSSSLKTERKITVEYNQN